MHWICKLRIPRISKDGKMDHIANRKLCKCSSTSQICKLIEAWFEPSNWRWFDGTSSKQNEKSNSQMRLIYLIIGHSEHLKLHLFTIHMANQWGGGAGGGGKGGEHKNNHEIILTPTYVLFIVLTIKGTLAFNGTKLKKLCLCCN